MLQNSQKQQLELQQRYTRKLENKNIGKIEETKKHIKKTALANSFYEVCLKEK